MIKNNFDISSSGIGLELSCFYDGDQATMDFEENFKILQHSGYRQNAIFVYHEGAVADDFEFYHWNQYEFKKQDLIEWLKEIDHMENLRERSQYLFSKPFSKLKMEELQELIEWYIDSGSDLGHEMRKNLTQKYDIIITRGHCQGDYAEVVIPAQFKKYLTEQGISVDLNKLSDIIDRLCWDVPVYARLDITLPSGKEVELFLNDYLSDNYDWDVDEITKNFKISSLDIFHKTNDSVFESESEIEYIAKWLEDNLPTELKYQK